MKKLFTRFPAFLTVAVCAILFSTCHKEYSYEGGPKKYTAVYTLAGAGGTCTGAILAGNFYVAKTLTNANTVQLQVKVDTAGSYNISTTTINGFHFSGSGNFANTGLQNVVLYASGTPSASGDFSFTATAGAGCSFPVAVTKEPVIMAGFTADCSKTEVSGRFNAGYKLTSAQEVTINLTVTAVGAYSITTDTLDGISFAASGTFSSTGSKTITLKGSGTPDFARNLVFSFNANGSTCNFNLTVTDSDPLAVYVLESGFGNPNPCISTVGGTYVLNTALMASNTVQINAYVTATGNYTIATATIGGIIFARSGVFTTTGLQQVILQGTGTPDTKGALSFAPEIVGPHPLGGQTCGFTIHVQ